MEIPPRFSGREPAHPGGAEQNFYQRAEGLAEDVRHYGQWLRDEAQSRIGHLYPKATGPDGNEYTVIAWKWARTVRSPNPANPIETPLVNSWWLSKKKGHEAWVKATVRDGQVHYEVIHNANGPRGDQAWTIKHGKGAKAVGDGTPFNYDYIRQEGREGRIGSHLIAVVAAGERGRLYLSPSDEQIAASDVTRPVLDADGDIATNPRWFSPPAYGLTKFSNLFTNRQLVALTTLSDLVGEARERVLADALSAGMPPGERLRDGGTGAQAYADAVATYLALAVSRQTDRLSSLSSWQSIGEKVRNVFARQAIPMVWDYAEVNPFSSSSGNFLGQVEWVSEALSRAPACDHGYVRQISATERAYNGLVVSTDPPYYDNIGYSDLSDFFYVWLRRCLHDIHPEVVGTMLTPKAEELVANPYRHDGKEGAAKFFVEGFNAVFARIRQGANPAVPMTVYYAYKQQDVAAGGNTSTGWHTLLAGLIDAGWEITATWPMRSERGGRMLSIGTNALASSIVLACRPRPADAPATTRRALTAQLKTELPGALRTLMQGAVAPVDLAQATIGPGISVFSRYTRVREADGTNMTVGDALTLINATLDEVLGEQEADTDPDTRFATRWYRQYGWEQGSAGLADQLARSCDTSLGALERGGIFQARGGKARLLTPSELDGQWNPEADDRISIWEATVRLAAVMGKEGVERTAQLLAQAQRRISPDSIRELGFLLFHEAEKQHHTEGALLFNGLVTAWADITGKARRFASAPAAIQDGFNMNGED
ncbi:DUF1156 domain-containing protein [Actinomyces sp. 594]|uniref:DUF1156 domain-containing protein n=1 Tax=Actinomyces sp. 594 TaxID=2057793 RepID=UPI001C57AD20|nr:hypothetical protein [Actinomyces sp. 594]